MAIKKRLYILMVIVSSSLCGAQLETLEEENKRADRAFLEWKLTDTNVLPALKKTLTPSYMSFLIDESSLPFGVHPSQKLINERVAAVTESFLKKIGPEAAKKIPKWQLKNLVTEIIRPEYVFENDISSRYRLDALYNDMMDTLAERPTPAGTTLKQWALRFLIAESVIIALSALERLTLNNKKFVELTPRNQEKVLEPVVDLVANRFISNLDTVRHQYQLVLPERIDDAIKYKVRLFLREKFITR